VAWRWRWRWSQGKAERTKDVCKLRQRKQAKKGATYTRPLALRLRLCRIVPDIMNIKRSASCTAYTLKEIIACGGRCLLRERKSEGTLFIWPCTRRIFSIFKPLQPFSSCTRFASDCLSAKISSSPVCSLDHYN
jgi:hypothetical protein